MIATIIGVSVLGHLFGGASVIPISVASVVMNVIQVPAQGERIHPLSGR
jgi:hypothetical protein